MTEWKEYTGSHEQIDEMMNAKYGFIARNITSESRIMRITIDQLFIEGQDEPYLPDLFGNKVENFLSFNNTTHYLICNPHPLVDMICQQARTGQPVWVRYSVVAHWWQSTEYEIKTIRTTTPDWNIPGAEYSFTPFED